MSFSNNRKYVLVTGANGFIGSEICRKLLAEGRSVKGVVRSPDRLSIVPDKVVPVLIGTINGDTDWGVILNNVNVVVHSAGVAHKTDKRATEDLVEYRRVNVIGTERLARACSKAGVRRFVFLSSIGVNGEFIREKPFTENDVPSPMSAYAVSKLEAEQALREVSRKTGMEVVILRLPLVYGPDAPGNFGRLMSLIKTGLPLPLGNIKSLRSFIYVGNAVDAIMVCMLHALAAGETFLVSDGQDVSTPDLVKRIACAMKKRAVLFSLPLGILKMLCKIAGKTQDLEKVIGSMLVDCRKIRRLLGWTPPFTLEEGIGAMVNRSGLLPPTASLRDVKPLDRHDENEVPVTFLKKQRLDS